MLLALALSTILVYAETGSPASGPLFVIRTDPHHPGTLLAGTAAAQLFRSRDGADTWTHLPFPGELRSALHAIVVDPLTPDLYLVAASSETPAYAGVYRTVDGGATWSQLPGLEHKQVWALTVWRGDPRIIAAGTQDGVFLTRDSGMNWERLSPPRSAWPRPVVSLAFDPANSKVLYAGTPHLAWKTADGGATWRRIPIGMEEDSDIFSIEVDLNQRAHLFAGACSGIYRSINGGGTWSSLEKATGGSFRTYVVARTPGRPHVVFAGTSGGLIQSADEGATWRVLSKEIARSIAFDAADSQRIFVATDRGILRSEDGGDHFRGANQGLARRD
jgi:photosystem II stability/assembly factor-like uncharacterized protein